MVILFSLFKEYFTRLQESLRQRVFQHSAALKTENGLA